MTAHPGFLDTTYELTDQLTNPFFLPGVSGTSSAAYDGPDTTYATHEIAWQPGGAELALLIQALAGPSTYVVVTVTSTAHPGYPNEGIGGLWWGFVHVLPRSISLGNVLSTTDVTIDIFNATRDASKNWTAFMNNAGAGTSMLSLSLPETFLALEGKTFTFRITLDGPGEVDTTLDYTFTGQGQVEQAISFTRVLTFPYRPETPIRERLSWLTSIVAADDGTEQRVALRDFPRQEFSFTVQRSSGVERQRFENIVFDRHAFAWGLPDYSQGTKLRSAASALDTQILLRTTTTSDFRPGKSLILRIDETTFETALINAVRPTNITLNSGLVSNYPVGTEVFPLRTVNLGASIASRRFPGGLTEYLCEFKVTDNETTLGATNFWPQLNSKVLLDDDNFVVNAVPEVLQRPTIVIDNSTGVIRQTSREPVDNRVTRMMWVTRNAIELHRVRQLLHALRGRQISFYLPTSAEDFTLDQPLSSGAATADVVNTGYTDHVQSRAPHDYLRVVKTDGTTIVREILSSSVISPAVEQLSVASNWGVDVALVDLDRVEFVEEVRLASDIVEFTHSIPGRTRIPVGVRTFK
jgi:hypothetical protein